MEPEEYERLEQIARQRNISVAELIRRAVRERYLTGRRQRKRAAARICRMELPIGDWTEIEAWIEESHDAGLR